MTLSEYDQLKQQIIYNLGVTENNRSLLTILKEFYKDDIDSPRRYEQINTIGELFQLLEIRDVLSEDNLTPFKEVCHRINNNELFQRILDYEKSHVLKDNMNCYKVEETQNSLTKEETMGNFSVGHPYGNISKYKKNRINQTIIEEIGNYWRDLARNLKVQEQMIDEIESQYHTVSEKVLNLLKFYEERADPQRGFLVLCNALEKSRRKDISKSIQETMIMNL